jgi:hypothetical protein
MNDWQVSFNHVSNVVDHVIIHFYFHFLRNLRDIRKILLGNARIEVIILLLIRLVVPDVGCRLAIPRFRNMLLACRISLLLISIIAAIY